MNTKRNDLLKCRDRLLGSRASRDNRRVWFEEQDRATDIGENTRCYGLSNMFERIPNTSAPPAALKVVDGKLDAVQLAVKDTLRASGILDKFCFTLIDLDDLVLHGHKYDYVVQDGAFRSSEDFGILRGYGKFA